MIFSSQINIYFNHTGGINSLFSPLLCETQIEWTMHVLNRVTYGEGVMRGRWNNTHKQNLQRQLFTVYTCETEHSKLRNIGKLLSLNSDGSYKFSSLKFFVKRLNDVLFLQFEILRTIVINNILFYTAIYFCLINLSKQSTIIFIVMVKHLDRGGLK